MKKVFACLVVALAIGSFAISPLHAIPVNVQVTGVVDSVTTYQNCSLDGSITQGSPMTGSCTYDTESMDRYKDDELCGYYWVDSMSMNMGNYTFEYYETPIPRGEFAVIIGDLRFWAISDSTVFDQTINIDGQKFCSEINWSKTSMMLFDLIRHTNDLGYDDSPPTWYPDISVFDWGKEFDVHFLDVNGNGFKVDGHITSIAVPEPAAMSLLLLGVLAAFRKKQS